MESTPKFTEQFCAWIKLLGTDARVSSGISQGFDRVEVSLRDKLLVFTLVDLAHWQDRKDENEFLQITSDYRESGSQHIVIWQDDWQARKEIVKSRIAAILGISQRIPARLTVSRRIDKRQAGGFLNNNHLQGSVSSKSRYGLFLPARYYRVLNRDVFCKLPDLELLVAVATFSHPRIFKRNDQPYRSYELIRYASLINTTVTGGLSKLLSAFVKDFDPGDIMTYGDLEWSEGASYEGMGFSAISDTAPMKFWLDPMTMMRFNSKIPVEEQEGKLLLQNLGSRKFVKDYL